MAFSFLVSVRAQKFAEKSELGAKRIKESPLRRVLKLSEFIENRGIFPEFGKGMKIYDMNYSYIKFIN